MPRTETITHISRQNLLGGEGILGGTVRERIDAIREASSEHHNIEDPEDVLMLLGALSALASIGHCAMSESLFDKLCFVIICFNTMHRDARDPGERYPQ